MYRDKTEDKSKSQLNLMCWNCRGVYSCIPFLADKLREFRVDICALSEHWLRTYQLHVLDSIDCNYTSIAKGSDESNPSTLSCNTRSGVAFLISKEIYPFVSVIDIDADRIAGIELNLPGCQTFFIFSIYLPATTQPNDYFKYYVEYLRELITVYADVGTVILMGDFNSQISGPRYQFKKNNREKACHDVLKSHNLFSVNMELLCKGPIATFQSYKDGPSTCIDHIIMNASMIQRIISAEVLDDHSFDLSDHHPIMCSLILDATIQTSATKTSYQCVNWDKARRNQTLADYTYAVSQNLWTLDFPDTKSNLQIEVYYSKIIEAIKRAESDTLPYKHFKAHVKPYWNAELTVLRDEMRERRSIWMDKCHCHNINCEYFDRYKSSKKQFREAIRKAVDDYESSLAKKIETDIDVDQKSISSILNRRKKKSTSCNALKRGDNVYTDQNTINEIWYDHFQSVFCKSSYVHPERENEIQERVTSIRNSILKEYHNDNTKVQLAVVTEICRCLKTNKASGHDDVAFEHIKYGGNLLIRHLCHLFNLCLQNAYTPTDWQKSIIVLLYKGDNKPRTDTNSYRGISIVPSITKIFEKVLDLLLTSLRSDFPNEQQVAYQKNLSSLNASLNLQEVTIHHVEKGGTINIILLDSTKAFDTVTHDGLRIKLYEYGSKGKIWLLLDNMYNNLTSAVLCNGSLTKWFKLNRGIRQGSALSAKLYMIFINDLINELQNSNKGAFIYEMNASSPVQADDISIIATNRESAQCLANICEQYSKDWSFSFSPSKSKFLQFGKKSSGSEIRLGNEPILQVTSARHVGIELHTSLKTVERTLKACRKLRSAALSVIRIGIHPSILNPIVRGKIIRQVCYPKALYGCELWGRLSNQETLMLERTHRYICKSIQGLPKLTRTDMCLSLIGWYSLESFIDE